MRSASIAAHVLQNRHEPSATVGTRLKSVKRLERLDHRFLHEILRFRSVPFEPQRQMKQPIDVRQCFRLEGGPDVIVGGRC